MLCQTSKVLLGKLKSYETMQGLVFLPLVAKFLMKWRFLLEPIGEFPSVVRTPKIGISFEALKVIAWKKSNLLKKWKKNFFHCFIPLRYVELTIFFTGCFVFQHDFEVFVRNVFSDASSEARMVLQSFGFTRLSLMTSQSFEFWRLFQKCWLPSKIDHSWEKCCLAK